jgi:DNA-binding response OmpR family regulator
MTASRKKILLVDDDDSLRKALADQLELHEEFETSEVEDAASALEALDQAEFDAILLDVALPDMDGRDVCRLIRRKGIHTPVIMITGLDGEADAILGLDSGANDYVTKPFRLGVLLARLRAHMRQHDLSEDAAFSVGPYTFKPSAKQLHHNAMSKDISLSDKESAILKHLYRAGDAAVSCDTLYNEIWDHAATLHTHTLQTHIYRLRQKIEDNPSHPEIIVSEHGGYRLVR